MTSSRSGLRVSTPLISQTASLLLAGGAIYELLLTISVGKFDAGCLWASLIVLGLVLSAVWLARSADSSRAIQILPGAAVLLNVALVVQRPSVGLYREWSDATAHAIAALVVVVVLAGILAAIADRLARFRLARAIVAAIALAHLATSVWILRHTPAPNMDVMVFHREGAKALAAGQDPYAITFPNVYAPATNDSIYYSRDVQRGGRLLFGYPYPPLSLALTAPSQLLFGDPRFGMALCYALTIFLAGTIAGGLAPILAACVLATSPPGFSVLMWGWTEPQVLLLFAASAWCAAREPKTRGAMLGLFFAVKQYSVVFIPLLWLLAPRPLTWRGALKALGVPTVAALAVTLPLALWNWPAFWNSNVHWQVIQPFRYDSFSFLAMFARAHGRVPEGASWLAFVLLIPLTGLLLWKLPRNFAGFSIGVGPVMMVFLLVNRQAFLNYHTFAAGALIIAAAIPPDVVRPRPDHGVAPGLRG